MRIFSISLFAAATSLAGAQSALQASYFALSGVSSGYAVHPDTGRGVDDRTVTGLVENNLGPNGLPVASSFGRTFFGTSGALTDFDTATGELQWWTAHTLSNGSRVLPDGSGTVSVPLDSDEYAFGATDNGAFYRTAHLQGTFNAIAGGTATLTLGADDDAWIFLNGALVVDDGGVHRMTPAPTTLTNLLAGSNRLDVFFADRHTVSSHLSLNSTIVLTPLPTPEPTAWAALGFGALALVRRRRAR